MSRKTQNEKTLKDVLVYIKANMDDGQKLKESMIRIGEQTGYANATIHRALLTLQDRGLIEVIPASRSGEANTIQFVKDPIQEPDDLLYRATVAMRNLESAVRDVQDLMKEFRDRIDFIDMGHDQQYIELH